MGCTESTYIERLIAWYIGAEEIENCLQTKKLSCLKGLALSAFKLKAFKGLKGCEKNSFVPGTRVLMADRRTKPIEDLRVGDKVVATDPKSGQTAAKSVRATITGDGQKNLVDITVANPGAESTGTLVATDQHPFWVAGDKNAWLDAAELKPGDRLRTDEGTYAQVNTTKTWTTPGQRVHNLTIADLHTYYVLAGETPVLVHNNKCTLGASSEAATKAAANPAGIFIKNKHLSSFAGKYAKFDTADIPTVQAWVAEGLKSERAVFKPNGLNGTCKVEVNMQRSIGTKGQTGIRIIVTNDGRVINAFPINM